MSRPNTPNLIRLHRTGEAASREMVPVVLGERVRELRKARGWTLQQAARHAGLARSTLSKIENGQMSPTYDALKKLVSGLEVSIPQLFTPPQKDQVSDRMTTTKSGQGESYLTTTYEHQLLSSGLTQKNVALPCPNTRPQL